MVYTRFNHAHGVKAVTIRLGFDCESVIRPPFDSHSTAIRLLRPFDDLRYDHRPTCVWGGAAALRLK